MKHFKKNIVVPDDHSFKMKELLIESDGFNLSTLAVLRTREATPEENLLYLKGLGTHLRF